MFEESASIHGYTWRHTFTTWIHMETHIHYMDTHGNTHSQTLNLKFRFDI